MENSKNIKNDFSEFDEYMVSSVIDEEPNTSQTWAGIGVGLAYLFILSSIVYLVWAILNPNIIAEGYDSTLEQVISQVIAGIIVVVATFFIIGKNKIMKIIKGFNLNNFGKALTFVGISFIALTIVGWIEQGLFGTNEVANENQQSVEDIIKNYKLLGFIFVVVMAPIVEEIIFRYFIFRGSLRIMKPVYAFIITVVSFAGIHYVASIAEGTLVEDLKSILEYIVPAFIMTYLYYKNKNLATPIMFHMLFNGIQWILMMARFNAPDISNSASGIIQALYGVLL